MIDWNVMRGDFWNNTIEHPDRKRRRQAEFLVQHSFPWTSVRTIGVHDPDIRRQVELLLRDAAHKPGIAIQPAWYY